MLESRPSEWQFPLTISPNFTVQRLAWADFRGRPDPQMPWSAHIYWGIEYVFRKKKNKKRPEVVANVVVLKNSWVKPEMKSQPLLEHEMGHYLIGCLCALEFLKRVDSNRVPLSYNFSEYVKIVFNSTLREYIKLQKKYDEETEHRLNFQKQEEWMRELYGQLLQHRTYYEQKRQQRQNELKSQSNSKKSVVRSKTARHS